MREFYLSVQGEPIRGPIELDEALGAMCRLNARLSALGNIPKVEPHRNPDNRGLSNLGPWGNFKALPLWTVALLITQTMEKSNVQA